MHHDNVQQGRAGAGAGWTEKTKETAFSSDLHYVITGPESFMEGVGAALTHFVFVRGGCILFIDAGTRVHLLDAKGLSFTENVFTCICYCLKYI